MESKKLFHPQPELEIWEEWCSSVYVKLAYSIIHNHAYANHNRHTNISTKSAFARFIFFPAKIIISPLSLPFIPWKNIPTCYPGAFGFVCFSIDKSCIFQAKLLASCNTPRADQGVGYSSVPFLPFEQKPCVWRHLPELNPVNSLTIIKKSCQECHVPFI